MNLLQKYQNGVDTLINTYGKTVRVFYKPTVSSVNTSFNDKVREDSVKYGYWREDNQTAAPTSVDNYTEIIALIKHNPAEFKNFNTSIKVGNEIIRLKTFLTDIVPLIRCDYIIPNYNVKNIIHTKYRLIMEPIPVGLGED